jgi:PAS domain S-box-containing protein
MPFSASYERHYTVEQIRRLRKAPLATYGIAIAAVLVATGIRSLLSPHLAPGLAFITFYPAIILSTLVGGLWPGLVATALSTLFAWYFFLVTPAGEGAAAFSVLVFLFISGINVGLVAFLDLAIDRVIAQEENVRVLIETAPNGVLVVDEGGRITLVNAALEQLFGYAARELMGREVEVLVADRSAVIHQAAREAFQRHPEARAMGAGRDLSGRRKDGSEVPVEIGLNPVARNGKRGILATVIDISERKRAQDQQRFLMREMQHRTKNMFAVMHAIVNRSTVVGRTPDELKHELGGRIQALARTYTLLAGADWKGAPLSEILMQELSAFSDRVKIEGCELVVNESAAQQFALIVHELATNAVKYGALSTANGHVSVSGSSAGGQFEFVWKETGGPTVKQPTHKGFGSTVLIDAAGQFAESVTVDYAPEGIRYALRVPSRKIEIDSGGDAFMMRREVQ